MGMPALQPEAGLAKCPPYSQLQTPPVLLYHTVSRGLAEKSANCWMFMVRAMAMIARLPCREAIRWLAGTRGRRRATALRLRSGQAEGRPYTVM